MHTHEFKLYIFFIENIQIIHAISLHSFLDHTFLKYVMVSHIYICSKISLVLDFSIFVLNNLLAIKIKNLDTCGEKFDSN